MSKIDLQYDLVNYTPASASPVEANFNRIEQHINQEVIERGGTVAMTAQLMLVGDPVSPLDAAPKQYVDQVLPIGIVMMFGGTVAPPGGKWALCNGAELESVTYPTLFAVIGQNFSPPGTPAGRFHLPNLVDRMGIGAGTIAAIGIAGGSKDAIVPLHNHGHPHVHDFSHSHPAVSTGTVSADHTHAFSGTTGIENASHNHANYASSAFLTNHDTGQPLWIVQDGPHRTVFAAPTSNWENQNHGHNFSGNTGGISTNHSHTVGAAHINGNTGGVSVATTDNAGVAATNGNLPPYLGISHIMRVT